MKWDAQVTGVGENRIGFTTMYILLNQFKCLLHTVRRMAHHYDTNKHVI